MTGFLTVFIFEISISIDDHPCTAQQTETLWSKKPNKLKQMQIWAVPRDWDSLIPWTDSQPSQPTQTVNYICLHIPDQGEVQPWQYLLSGSVVNSSPRPHFPTGVLPRSRGQRSITKSQEKPHLSLWASHLISQLRVAHATAELTHQSFLIHATNPTSQLVPEKDPLLGQCRQGAPLSDKHLHQVCREPFTPLNIAHAHLLAGAEKRMMKVLLANTTSYLVGVPRKLFYPTLSGGKVPCLGKIWMCCTLEAPYWFFEQCFSNYASTDDW